MAAHRDIGLLLDRALADGARQGDRAAFDELYRRHALAAWRLALAVTRDPRSAEAAVTSGFATTLAGRADGAGAERLRLTLLRATRRGAVDATGHHSASIPVAGALAAELADARVAFVRQAFDSLPERWRSILWLVDVEGCSPHDAARVIELALPAAVPLADRARLGFREQVLDAALPHPAPADCRRSSDRLSGYVAGTLSERDEARVRTHLDGCAACRTRLAALDDLVPVLQRATIALPDHLVDAARRRWSTSLTRDAGPLRLGLPGGQPVPVWAQRAVAGAVAAVVTLGITGATIVASRDRTSTRDVAIRPATSAGNSALVDTGLSDLVLPDPGAATTTPAASSGSDVASPPAGPRDAAGALPRSGGSSPLPAAGADLPPAVIPNTQQDPGSSPDAAGAIATVGVGGVVGATVGECNGAQVLGAPIGCAPPESDAPITVEPLFTLP